MDYKIMKFIGKHLQCFIREHVTNTIRLFWNSKEKYKITLMEGDHRVIELFYEETPVISLKEFNFMLNYIGQVEYVDFSFIDFDPDKFF